MNGNGRDFAHAARSVIETAGFIRGQAYRRAIRQIDCPVLLIHGERDRLVPVSAARMAAKAHPTWKLVVLPDFGHVPQLEAPTETAAVITSWLTDGGAEAVKAATPRAHRNRVNRRPGPRGQLLLTGGVDDLLQAAAVRAAPVHLTALRTARERLVGAPGARP